MKISISIQTNSTPLFLLFYPINYFFYITEQEIFYRLICHPKALLYGSSLEHNWTDLTLALHIYPDKVIPVIASELRFLHILITKKKS
jgi:hypothetical protein